MKNKIKFESELDEANYVYDWHMYSDKTSDEKLSDMSIEQAESILFANNAS